MGSGKRIRILGKRVRRAIKDRFEAGNSFHRRDLEELFSGVPLDQIREAVKREVQLEKLEELGGNRYRVVREEHVTARACEVRTVTHRSQEVQEQVPIEVPEIVPEESQPEPEKDMQQMEESRKENLSGFSKDPMRRAQLLKAVRAAIQTGTEQRVTVAQLVPRLQALPVDPWPEMDPASQSANYGRTIGTMIEFIDELDRTRDSRPGASWHIGLVMGADGGGEQEASLPEPANIQSQESVNRSFDTPKPVEMPGLTESLIDDLRAQLPDSFDFVRVYNALHEWDEDVFARTPGGLGRARSIFDELQKRSLIRQSPYDGQYSFVSMADEETIRLRAEVATLRSAQAAQRADLDRLLKKHPDLMPFYKAGPDQFFTTLGRLMDTQREIIRAHQDALNPKQKAEIQSTLESISDAFFEE